MKKRNASLVGAINVLLIFVLISCSNPKPFLNDSQTKDEQEILVMMDKWGKALTSGDIDSTMTFYSENFSGTEAKNKTEMKAMLTEAKSYGMLWLVKIDLTTAQLEVSGDSAEITIFNDDGELEMDFYLFRERGDVWRITGIPSETCDYEDYVNPYGDDCIWMTNHYRCWDIFIPDNLNGMVPLVIDFHGWTENAPHQRAISDFENLAITEGFIVVWPRGLCNSWNAGPQCCSPASDNQIDDIGFVRNMIARLADDYEIDKNRVYVTGLSNGCAMAQRVANEASDLVAAAACMSLHLLTEEASGYNPVSIMTIMGTHDDLYEATDEMPGARENMQRWKQMNNCKGEYQVTQISDDVVSWTYENCNNDTQISLVTIEGGGHMLYQGHDTDINTTQLAWDFLQRFQK